MKKAHREKIEDYLSGLGTREGSGPSSSLDANTAQRQDARAANNADASPDLNDSQQIALDNYRAASEASRAHMSANQTDPTWSAMAGKLADAESSASQAFMEAMKMV